MIKLEGYKIIKKLASGGMGDVYLAVHSVLESKVAIKSLHSDLVKDENFRKRFRKEGRTQSRLSHPNIVKLIDFQERKNGLFLIMEFIEGKQLNDYINNETGPIPENKLIPLFKQILSAIQYAHTKKLIHRDIKPSNILITNDGNAKIIDFGIAKSDDEEKGLTKTGLQLGTVTYMSPEQVNAEGLDKLTDIYSLGVVLFQMAVGQSPYSNKTSSFKIQLSIVKDPLPNPTEIYPSVSKKLVSIIKKASEKNKRDRFQSCEEFIKSFDKEFVVEKIKKSNSEKNITKPLVDTKKAIPIKNKRKTPFFVYIITGLILMVSISIYYYYENRVYTSQYDYVKINEDNQELEIQNERLSKIEEDRLAKLKEERLVKLEEESLAKLEEESLAKLEDERLVKLQEERNSNNKRLAALEEQRSLKNKLNNSSSSISVKNYNNGVYEGEIMNNTENGFGKFTWSDGDVYEGDWKDGIRSGKGKYIWPNGNVYEGDWKDGIQSGKGKFTSSDGNVYEGDWKDGIRSGKGKYTWSDGDVYEGDWKNDERTGTGKFTWSYGVIFEGNFNNGEMGFGYRTLGGKKEFGEYNKRGKWKKRKRGVNEPFEKTIIYDSLMSL